MIELDDAEREAIEHDRELAWDLFDAQPTHPQIPVLAHRVLARAPQFTGMIILLAKHHAALGEVDRARQLLQELVGRADRQLLGAVRELRDLEYDQRNFSEALRLAEIAMREPAANWLDLMDLASAEAYAVSPEAGWRRLDEAVDLCASSEPDEIAFALGQRALRLLASGAPPERFIPSAQEAMDADPSDPEIAVALAYAYLYDYQPERSEEILRRILREDPTNVVAQGGLTVARGFLAPIERGDGTMEDFRNARMGEVVWRMLRDQLFGTGMEEALAALDAVIPADLAASLRPPLSEEEARASGGDRWLVAWHDGQQPGAGALWGTGDAFRLMTATEIAEMDASMESNPEAWPHWHPDDEYFVQIFTDDAGSYVIEGPGGRLYRRDTEGVDHEVAPSLADWVWDRVAAFGGQDRRPGR